MDQDQNTLLQLDTKEQEFLQILITMKSLSIETYNNIEQQKMLRKSELAQIIENYDTTADQVSNKEQKYLLKQNSQRLAKLSQSIKECLDQLEKQRQYLQEMVKHQEIIFKQIVDLKKYQKRKLSNSQGKMDQSSNQIKQVNQFTQTEEDQSQDQQLDYELIQDEEINQELEIILQEQSQADQVLVSNIPIQLNLELIKQFFSLFGDIKNFQQKQSQNVQQQSKSYEVIIQFDKSQTAGLVIQRVNGYYFNGQMLQIQLYNEKQQQSQAQTQVQEFQNPVQKALTQSQDFKKQSQETQVNNQISQEQQTKEESDKQKLNQNNVNIIDLAEKFLLEAQSELKNPSIQQKKEEQVNTNIDYNSLYQIDESESISSNDINELIKQHEKNKQQSVASSDINSENYDVFPTKLDLRSIFAPQPIVKPQSFQQRSKTLDPHSQYLKTQLDQELLNKKCQNLLISNISQTALQGQIIPSTQQYQMHDYYEAVFQEMLKQVGSINYISVFDDYQNQSIAAIVEFEQQVGLMDIFALFPHATIEPLD